VTIGSVIGGASRSEELTPSGGEPWSEGVAVVGLEVVVVAAQHREVT